MNQPNPTQQPLFPNSPSPPAAEPLLPDVQSWPSSERLARLNELRLKMDQTGQLTPDECRLGVRLIAAERIARAGSQGGSKAKAKAAPESFKAVTLDDL